MGPKSHPVENNCSEPPFLGFQPLIFQEVHSQKLICILKMMVWKNVSPFKNGYFKVAILNIREGNMLLMEVVGRAIKSSSFLCSFPHEPFGSRKHRPGPSNH